MNVARKRNWAADRIWNEILRWQEAGIRVPEVLCSSGRGIVAHSFRNEKKKLAAKGCDAAKAKVDVPPARLHASF
jgi:hypothetical protein